MVSFSLIICAYNPDEQNFRRLLNALLSFETNNPAHEVIIVDNHSSPALEQLEYVQAFLRQKSNASIICEKTAGLTAARIAGIRKAQADWIVFFDDDNEPSASYLKEAAKITATYEQVGAWGPGVVDVEFPAIDYEKKFRKIDALFQQRHEHLPRFSTDQWWQDWYPAGTGLIVRGAVATAYALLVSEGEYRLTDRKGKTLSSGGDLQIVLTAIKMGFAAGVHPQLILKHLITKEKLASGYLKRLAFGTAASNVPGHLQVWKSALTQTFHPPSSSEILKQLYYHLKVKLGKDGLLKTQVSFCAYLGALHALYELNPSVKPSIWWRWLCVILQVK